MIEFIAILIGYILGSISPSFILGKLLRGIDIREHGDGNAGATNTKHVLGLGPAILVVVYDLFKGLLAIFIAYKLGLSVLFIYLAGYGAILGHIAPFYLRFKGGQGAATAVGMLLFSLSVLILRHNFPFEALVILAVAALAVYIVTRNGTLVGIVILPILVYLIFANFSFSELTICTVLLVLFLFSLQVYLVYKKKLFKLKPRAKRELIAWRLALRPLAAFFPILYFYTNKKVVLIIIGVILVLASIPDIIRLLLPKVNEFFFGGEKRLVYKKGEKKKFSSITLFLFSAFIVILIFPKAIAIVAVLYLIFGDIFSKIFGIQFGRTPIFPKYHKDLEGALAHFSICLAIGYIMTQFLPIALVSVVIGAFIASIVETIPLGVNDNLSVGLTSAAAMYIIEVLV